MTINLRAARANVGMRQEDVCRQLGITRGTLSRWENGKTFPTAKQMRTLCELYGVKEEDISL